MKRDPLLVSRIVWGLFLGLMIVAATIYFGFAFLFLAVLVALYFDWGLQARERLLFAVLFVGVLGLVLWRIDGFAPTNLRISLFSLQSNFGPIGQWIIDVLLEVTVWFEGIFESLAWTGNGARGDQSWLPSYAVSLTVLVLYLLARLCVGALAATGRLFTSKQEDEGRKEADELAEEADQIEKPALEFPEDLTWIERQRIGAQKYAYVGAFLLLVLAITYLPILKQFKVLEGDVADASNFFWALPAILVLELAFNAMREIKQPFWSLFAGLFRSRSDPPLGLAPVFDVMKKRHSDALVPLSIPPLVKDHAEAAEHSEDAQLALLQGEIDKKIQDPGKMPLITISETMSPVHFRLLVQLMQSQAFDSGGSVWIICADHAVEELQAQFARAARHSGTEFLQVWHYLNKRRGKEMANADVIVGTIEEFENFFDPLNKYFSSDIQRLSAIFVFQLDQIDLGLLKILGVQLREQISRIAYAGEQTSLFYVAQFERARQLTDRFRNLFVDVGGSTQDLESLQEVEKLHRYHLLWQDGAPLQTGLMKYDPHVNQIVKTVPAIIKQTWLTDPEYDCYVFDPKGAVHQEYLKSQVPRAIKGLSTGNPEQDKRLQKNFETLGSYRVVPPRVDAPVVSIEDHGNMTVALGLAIPGGASGELLTNVFVGNYPFADVLLDRVRSVRINGKKDQDVLTLLRNLAEPIAPEPSGGLVELALVIGAELTAISKGEVKADSTNALEAKGFLPQSTLDRFFLEISHKDEQQKALLEEIGVTPSVEGLRRLFELVFGTVIALDTRRARNHEIGYRHVSGPVSRSLPIAIARPQINTKLQEFILPLADFGLTYDDGTTLRNRGRQYQINNVSTEGEQTFVNVKLHDEGDAGEHTWVFRRGYVLVKIDQGDIEDFETTGLVGERPEKFRGNHAIGKPERCERPERPPIDIALCHIQVERRSFESLTVPRLSRKAQVLIGNRKAARGHTHPLLRTGMLVRIPVDNANLSDPLQRARTAFTLATTLQDTIAVLFPNLAARTAVLAPDAIGLAQRLRQEKNLDPGQDFDDATRLALFRQPVLTCREGGHPTDNPRKWEGLRKVYGKYFEALGEDMMAGLGQTQIRPAHAFIDLLLIEDADHDLGVSRAAFASFAGMDETNQAEMSVLGAWQALIEHTVKAQRSRKSAASYYKFMTSEIPDVYDFEMAQELLG